MKVAIYARVSTRDKGQILEMQQEPLRQHAQSMGYEIFKEYVDKASASALDKRTAWEEMMEDARHHLFDVLLVWKLDRAFRSMIHASNTIALLKQYRVAFHSFRDSLIFDDANPMGKLQFHLLVAFAEFEKDTMMLRINEGIHYAQEHGTKSGKPIGRVGLNITTEEVQAIYNSNQSFSETARVISKRLRRKVSPGFVATRIKRSLQKPGGKIDQ